MQALSQNVIVTEATDLVTPNKNDIIRVLHVDDDSSFLEVSKLLLTDIESGFEIEHASCVDEGLGKLSVGQYDVVVSDYEMPKKDGLEFLKELRQLKNKIPFILFTGKGREEVAIRALNLGADRYYNKDGSPETVYGELAYGIKQLVHEKNLNEKLCTEEENFKQLFTNTPMAIAIYKPIDQGEDYVFKGFNPAAEKIEKTEKTAVLGKRLTEAFPGAEKFGIVEIFRHVWKTGQPQHFPAALYQDKKDSGSWRENWVFKLPNQNIVAIYNDITQRKRTEEKLHESLNSYRSLINGMNDTAWVIDFSGNFLEVNDAAVRVLGYSREELLSIGIKEIDKHLTQEQVQNLIVSLPSAGKQVFETVHTTKDGEKIPVEISSSVVTYQGKQAILSIARNITERKKSEELLRSSQAQLQAVISNAPIGIAVTDSNFIIKSANEAFGRIVGYSEEELRRMTFADFTHPDDLEESNANMAMLFSGDVSIFNVERRHIRKDGVVRNGKVTVSAIRDKEGKPTLYIVELEDVTESIIAEGQLQESELRYRSLFEQAPIPVAITSLDGTILEANAALQAFTGYAFEELKKFHVDKFYDNPQDRETLLERLKREDVISDFSTRLKDRNGKSVDVVLNVSKFQIGKECFLRTTIQDVSERAKAEEALNHMMDSLMLVNEKLGVVGSLTRHDVRNKLSTVTSYAYLLKKRHPDQADIVDGLVKIEQAVKETVKIFDFAKMYEQLGAEELTYVDVETKVNEATTLLSGSLPKIICECQGLTVLSDSFLRQLFYNLIDNTRKYGKKTTTIRMHYEKTDDDLKLIYEDDGVGIPLENKTHLFSEGYSTGGSTGFGLFLIKKMIDIYGWTIRENGEPGKGVKFIMTIPKMNKIGKKNYQIAPTSNLPSPVFG